MRVAPPSHVSPKKLLEAVDGLRRMAAEDGETELVEACDVYKALVDVVDKDPSREKLAAIDAQFAKMDQLQAAYLLRLEKEDRSA